MNLFKSLEKHLNDIDVNIVIAKNEEQLTVSFLPKPKCKDDAKKQITPLLLRGTAEELDAEFLTIIQKPLESVTGITSNLIQFEESVKKMEKDNAKIKAEKEKNKKLKEKADKLLKEADAFIKDKNISKAILKIKGALKIYPEYKKAQTLLKKHDPTATGIFDEIEKIKEIEDVVVEEKTVTTKEIKEEVVVPDEPIEERIPEVGPNPDILVEDEVKEMETVDSDTIEEVKENVSLDNMVKPVRRDYEPIQDFEKRIIEWNKANPNDIMESAMKNTPSELEAMTLAEREDREAIFEAEKPDKVEEDKSSSASDNFEILG